MTAARRGGVNNRGRPLAERVKAHGPGAGFWGGGGGGAGAAADANGAAAGAADAAGTAAAGAVWRKRRPRRRPPPPRLRARALTMLPPVAAVVQGAGSVAAVADIVCASKAQYGEEPPAPAPAPAPCPHPSTTRWRGLHTFSPLLADCLGFRAPSSPTLAAARPGSVVLLVLGLVSLLRKAMAWSEGVEQAASERSGHQQTRITCCIRFALHVMCRGWDHLGKLRLCP